MINLQKRDVMKKIFYLGLVLLFCYSSLNVSSQTSYLMGTNRIVTEGCESYIYDNGGELLDYGINRMDTITIYSNDATNTKIQLLFNSFNIASGDTLFIYDSNIANPAKLVSGGLLNMPWFNNTNPITTDLPFFTASSSNPSGAITLRFKSNATNNAEGFKITSLCSGGCQPVLATINPSLSIPPLVSENNIFYSNLCPNVQFSIKGYGVYPENDITYSQSDNTSTFTWTFNDTAVYSGVGLSTFTPTFPITHASEIKLSISDVRNCASTNNALVRVRPSSNPIIGSPTTITSCIGENIVIHGGTLPQSDIQLFPVGSSSQSSFSNDTILFIPDGPNCAGMDPCLTQSVLVNSASPSQTIESSDDIQSIILKIEHSYMGDLEIKIICPNLQSTMIHAQPNGGGVFLGSPIDDNGGCSPNLLLAGTGWNYAWSETTTLGYTYHGTPPNYLHLGQTTRCDSTDLSNKTNFYKPMQSFSSLIGCPINGVWSIQICDRYGIDDGYLFNWSLNLNPNLVASSSWGYTIPIDEILWAGANITVLSDTSAMIIPTEEGTFPYTYTVVDAYGCAYDSTFNITVLGSSATISYEYPLLTSSIADGNQWYIQTTSGIFDIPGANQQTYEPYETGTYFTVISGNNCASDTSNKIYVDLSNSIIEPNSLSLQIIPNPSNGIFQICLAKTPINTSLSIITIEGKTILTKELNEKTSLLDARSLNKGIYFIRIKNSEKTILKKLIIE